MWALNIQLATLNIMYTVTHYTRSAVMCTTVHPCEQKFVNIIIFIRRNNGSLAVDVIESVTIIYMKITVINHKTTKKKIIKFLLFFHLFGFFISGRTKDAKPIYRVDNFLQLQRLRTDNLRFISFGIMQQNSSMLNMGIDILVRIYSHICYIKIFILSCTQIQIHITNIQVYTKPQSNNVCIRILYSAGCVWDSSFFKTFIERTSSILLKNKCYKQEFLLHTGIRKYNIVILSINRVLS